MLEDRRGAVNDRSPLWPGFLGLAALAGLSQL
jgi:hypothetical protein